MLFHRYLKYTFFLIILLSITQIFAQPTSQRKDLNRSKQEFGPSLFSFDTYFFMSDEEDNKSRMDVYVAFANDILQFIKERQGDYSAGYELLVSVFDKKGNLVDEQSVTKKIVVKNFNLTNDRRLSNRHKLYFNLIPSEYKLIINLTDNDTQSTLKREKKIKIKSFQFKNALMSEVLFLDKLNIENDGGINGIVPNLSRKFVNPESSFWAQFELYPKNFTDSLSVDYSIIDMNSHTIARKSVSILPDRKIIQYLIDLSKHIKISGRYFLILHVSQNEVETKRRFKFSSNWSNEKFSKINIEVALKIMKDFIPSSDYKRLKNSADSVKKAYFKKYWKDRDPTSDTEKNELLEEFYRRVNFSNSYFSVNVLDIEGWETDRGAIYIKYGQPTEVERHLDEINLPPFEIWFYEKQQRRFFFEDRSGRGEFKLVRVE